jgi:uncharacterized membrane protein YdbT with pleckstrin-like domain
VKGQEPFTGEPRAPNGAEIMSYIDKDLMTGERVIYRTQLHKIVFLWPVVIAVLALLVWSEGADAGLTILLVGVGAGIYCYMNFQSSEFGITNKRVLVKDGIFGRRSIEILLSKVEGISVNQGMLGKTLDYGTIIVSGTGGTKEPFKAIARPFEFRKQVQEQIASVQSAK